MNHSLERRVAERTAELQPMIEGLQSFARAVLHDRRGSLGGTVSRPGHGAVFWFELSEVA